ncbi:uncharacterized protein PFLUO_LOCUS3135 [Penicillium psychrofluorescens]|uniref:uncharacterized protein n=1 Tax=Penicillium psychrofluorescens TaxID=3158075 RepID=UPI003CCD45C4
MAILRPIVAAAVLVTQVAGQLSSLGTLDAPTLPLYLNHPGSTAPNPWNNQTAQQVNPNEIPYTGVVRRYHFSVARGTIAPDGVDRPVLLVNGQFPGPTIEANWGDTIEVTVANHIVDPAEGTTIHWHGLRMIGTQWMDGVPSTVQCPIAPGSSFTYTFRADAYGSTFWHSHYGAQYSGGIFGALIVYGPQHVPYDVDLGPVLLFDWYHANYLEVVESVVGLPAPTTQAYSDNNLINGRTPYDCNNPSIAEKNLTCSRDATYSQFRFTKGKTYRLRIMNVSSQGFQRFTIDGMRLTVIASDFVPIVPYETDVLSIGIGQRADVLVHATGESTDAVWMRSDVSANCAVSYQPHAKAAIYYEDADVTQLPNTTATPYDDSHCGDVPLNLTTPVYPMDPPATPAVTQQMDIQFLANETGNLLWYVNNETFRANYEHPVLLLAKAGNTSYPNPDWLVYNFGSNSSVRIILYNYSFTNRSQHPMHLHGHNFWIVAEGVGEWDGVANLKNPMRRDTFILQPGDPVKGPGYMVMEFVTDNPGVWPLHCHLAWHVSAGLYVNVLEHPEKILNMEIPHSVYQNCRDWADYKGVDLVPEIDSGV